MSEGVPIQWDDYHSNPNTTLIKAGYNLMEEDPVKAWTMMITKAEELGAEAGRKDDTIKSLQADGIELEFIKASKEGDRHGKHRELNKLRGLLNKTQQELKNLQGTVAELKAEKDSITKKSTKKTIRIEELKDKIKGVKQDLLLKQNENADNLVRISHLKNKLKRVGRDMKEMQNKLANLEKTALSQAREESSLTMPLRTENDELRAIVQSLRAENGKLRDASKEVEKEHNTYRDAFAAMYHVAKNEPLEGTEEETRACLEKAKSLLGV